MTHVLEMLSPFTVVPLELEPKGFLRFSMKRAMARLYLDIETFRQRDAFDEKIVVIGVIEDWSRANSSEGRAETLFFPEREFEEEEKIVADFFKYLSEISGKARTLEIVGFGILRFDIPLLTQKFVEHGLAKLESINKLFYDAYVIDLFQALLPFNNMRFKGNTLENALEKARILGLDPPDLYGKGADVKKHYEEGNFDEIKKHLDADLRAIRFLHREGLPKIVKNP